MLLYVTSLCIRQEDANLEVAINGMDIVLSYFDSVRYNYFTFT